MGAMPPSPRAGRPRSGAARTRAGVLLVALLGALLVATMATACGASDPPPRNPADERAASDATPAPTADDTGDPPSPIDTPTPDPTANATPSPAPGDDTAADADRDNAGATNPNDGNGASNAGTPPATDSERAVATAIERLAEWAGVPPGDLEPAGVEAVEWSDACLGIDRPDLACADVITPGMRVELQTPLGATGHVVHVSEGGRAAWAHERTADAAIIAIDPASGIVSVSTADGDEEWLVAPGSDIDAPLAALDAGMPVVAGLDTTPDGTAIVWLVVQ